MIYFVIAALLCIPTYWLWRGQQEKKLDVMSRGDETIGTVINRGMSVSSGGTFFNIHFEFEQNGKRVVRSTSVGRWEYENAIIGMKYKVKYLPDGQRNGSALILINEPIESEFVNIEKERERIFKTSNSARRNARPLDEIQHLIPRSE